MPRSIEYSDKYTDEKGFEYRHVLLPSNVARLVPRGRLMDETEWRHIGVTMSRGWKHYMVHRPEPHILLFHRPVGTDPVTGEWPATPPPEKTGDQLAQTVEKE